MMGRNGKAKEGVLLVIGTCIAGYQGGGTRLRMRLLCWFSRPAETWSGKLDDRRWCCG